MIIIELLLAVLAAVSLTISVVLAQFVGLGWIAYAYAAVAVSVPVGYALHATYRRRAARPQRTRVVLGEHR